MAVPKVTRRFEYSVRHIFYKGDTVECLKDYNEQFTKGKLYTITEDGYRVNCYDDRGVKNGWAPLNFKLLTNYPVKQAVCGSIVILPAKLLVDVFTPARSYRVKSIVGDFLELDGCASLIPKVLCKFPKSVSTVANIYPSRLLPALQQNKGIQ